VLWGAIVFAHLYWREPLVGTASAEGVSHFNHRLVGFSILAFIAMVCVSWFACVAIGRREQVERLVQIQRDLGTALNASCSLEDSLTRVLDAVMQIDGIDCAAVFRVVGEHREAELLAHRGVSPKVVDAVRLRTMDSPHAKLLETGEAVYGAFTKVEKCLPMEWCEKNPRGVALVPARHEGRIVAVLETASCRYRMFPSSVRHTLESLGDRIGAFIARFQAENALRETEDRLRLMLESADDVMGMLDLEGRCFYFNGPSRYGITSDLVLGKKPEEFLPPAGVEVVMKPFYEVIRTGKMQKAEYNFHWQGSPVWFSAQIFPVYDAQGRLAAVAHCARNITERKKAEEALHQERDFAENLIQAAPAIVLVLDLVGGIARSNPFFEKLVGYRSDELRGRNWFDTFVPESQRAARAEVFRMMAPCFENNSLSNVIRTKSGELRHIEWNGRTLHDDAGTAIGVLVIGRDITELGKAQQRALQLERLAAIGQMVAGLAHESGNALQRSQSCLEMLGLELQGRPSAMDLVQRIQTAQDDLRRLYQEVRHYAAPIVLRREPASLADIVDHAWNNLAMARNGRSAELLQDAAQDAEPLLVDRYAMERVFRNLMQNALDAVHGPVRVEVAWKMVRTGDRRHVCIGLCDNGPGFDPEQEANAFEPFRTTKTHGTGLGLAICRRIVEAHGGQISLKHRCECEQGAEIQITLPCE
jgi:PAS domain S-box-containing protein